MFIDSHAHLSMLIKERGVSSGFIIKELNEKNVKTVFNISGNNEELEYGFSLNNEFNSEGIKLFQVAGVHPHEAQKATDDYTWIRKNRAEIVAVGEVGLDFYYDFSPEKDQKKVFRNMIELSIELKKPLIIHGRNAEEHALEIIEQYGKEVKNVLFHCYTGDRKTALRIIKKGWFISFSGILTFKKSTDFHELLKEVGTDQILFETDSPFLAPVPFRGKVNTPGKVFHVYEFASQLLKIDVNDLKNKVFENIEDFFKVKLR